MVDRELDFTEELKEITNTCACQNMDKELDLTEVVKEVTNEYVCHPFKTTCLNFGIVGATVILFKILTILEIISVGSSLENLFFVFITSEFIWIFLVLVPRILCSRVFYKDFSGLLLFTTPVGIITYIRCSRAQQQKFAKKVKSKHTKQKIEYDEFVKTSLDNLTSWINYRKSS